MSNTFNGCHNLTTIYSFDTSNVTDTDSMFVYCSNLNTFPSFNMTKANSISNMFGNYYDNDVYIKSLGPLVNLGNNFGSSAPNSYILTLDLYGITNKDVAEIALSELYNISSQNYQQILLQGEVYYDMSHTSRENITSKGWLLIQMGNVCLTGDMKLQTPDGLIDIKDLKVGDRVYTYNEETKRQNTTEVTKVVNHNNLQIYTFTLSNGEEIKCTARHQFLVNSDHFDEYDEETDEHITVSKIDYMEARLIDLTDRFITKSGEEITITNIDISDNEQLVYEINTSKGNNYLLGEDSIIVKQEIIEDK